MKLKGGFASFLAFGVLACGSTRGSGFGPEDGGMPVGDGGSVESDGGNMIVGSNDGGNPTTGGPAEVYGHSPDTLYKLDPNTKAIVVVGKFVGCGTEVIDLALDATSNMYVTSQNPGAIFKVDRGSAKCTHIANGAYPNSLSFVPKGTLDPSVEALVGYVGSTYVSIDTGTGAITNLGDIGSGYASSGDIVSVIGGGTYLTVTGGGCVGGDCIIEVNPATGAFVKNLGVVGHSSVFGLAFWAGVAYGFDNAGDLFQINFTTGSVTTSPIAIPSKPGGLKFWGAGSTTSAPPTAAK